MKKLLLVFIMFFICIFSVYAEELVIDDIQVNNGVITPKYDKYNNNYSVTIDNDINILDLNIIYDHEKYDIEITGNNNLTHNKLIYITILNKNTGDTNTYTFKVHKQNISDKVINIDDNISKLDIKENDNTEKYTPIIGTICFILIAIVFYVMFLKNKID